MPRKRSTGGDRYDASTMPGGGTGSVRPVVPVAHGAALRQLDVRRLRFVADVMVSSKTVIRAVLA
ncbi:hypothetical protein [Streptomyces sp. NPDC001348]